MLILVIGGAASGKSEIAESIAQRGNRRIYLATMHAADAESRERVEKHRRMRKGKGFQTVESPTGMTSVSLPECDSILLEDLSNLIANEMFLPDGCGAQCVARAVMDGIAHLRQMSQHLVIVSNDVFGDGAVYDAMTEQYRSILAQCNRGIAEQADIVMESVCGIPVYHKGKGLL